MNDDRLWTYYVNGWTPDDQDHEILVQAVSTTQAKAIAKREIDGVTLVDCMNLNADD